MQYCAHSTDYVNTLCAKVGTGCVLLEPIQVKLARVALGLGVRELAEAADIAPSTITRFESGKGGMQARTLDKIQRVLERGGVVFIDADTGGGVGVRLKR